MQRKYSGNQHRRILRSHDQRAKRKQFLVRIVDTVKLAYRLKIGVEAGGGIGFNTIGSFGGLKEIGAFTIGHSVNTPKR